MPNGPVSKAIPQHKKDEDQGSPGTERGVCGAETTYVSDASSDRCKRPGALIPRLILMIPPQEETGWNHSNSCLKIHCFELQRKFERLRSIFGRIEAQN